MSVAQVIQFPQPTVEDELASKVERFQQLKAMNREFEALKKELKAVFQDTESLQVGGYTVTGKWVSQPEKKIPAFTYWDMRVK